MLISELISEIESDLSSFAGEINRTSIRTNIINQLRIFGTNITDIKEKVDVVKNSQVRLPDDFKSLKLALKLHSTGYNSHGVSEPTEQIIKQYIENPAFYDRISGEYITSCNSKIITEKIIVENHRVDCFYEPQWLSLVKNIKRDNLDSQCLNLNPAIRHTQVDTINITNGYLNTNFSTGKIYYQYNALATDEFGELIIPEFTTGDLREYLMLYCKIKVAEQLIVNNGNPQALSQMYQVWSQQLPLLKSAALKEVRFAGLKDSNWQSKFASKNREEIAFFGLPSLPKA